MNFIKIGEEWSRHSGGREVIDVVILFQLDLRDFFREDWLIDTRISPTDLQNLKPNQIYSDSNQATWMKYVCWKSIITTNIPLLIPAIELLNKHGSSNCVMAKQTCFPKGANQELNKGLKIICDANSVSH